MAKIQISKEEVKQMIKEEYFRKITEIKLKNRLQKINEAIQEITSDDDLEEDALVSVQPSGKEKVRSTGWAGEKGGDEKFGAKFTVKEEGEFGEEMTDDEMSMNDEMPMDDESLEGDLDIEAILAKLADAIEDKIETVVGEKMGGETEMSSDEMSGDEMSDEDEIDIEEVPASEDNEEEEEEDENVVKEQDGTAVVNATTPDNKTPFDNGKANIQKTGSLVSESTLRRMQILSGIKANDFHDKM